MMKGTSALFANWFGAALRVGPMVMLHQLTALACEVRATTSWPDARVTRPRLTERLH
jgi:hypothetical protein